MIGGMGAGETAIAISDCMCIEVRRNRYSHQEAPKKKTTHVGVI